MPPKKAFQAALLEGKTQLKIQTTILKKIKVQQIKKTTKQRLGDAAGGMSLHLHPDRSKAERQLHTRQNLVPPE